MRLIGETKENCEKKAIDYLKSTLYAENPDSCRDLYIRLDSRHRHNESYNELYNRSLKQFKALFGVKDEQINIALWNQLIDHSSKATFIESDFTKEEYAFIKQAIETPKLKIEFVNVNLPIETDRLLLRAGKISDVDLFFDHFEKDGDFTVFSGLEASDENIYCFTRFSPLFFSVEEKTTHTLIGHVGLSPKILGARWLEYYIFKEFRNKGYCKEAVLALLKKAQNKELVLPVKTIRDYVYSQKRVSLNTIKAWVLTDNKPSIKVLQDCGFLYEATIPHAVNIHDVGWADKEIYCLNTAN